METSSNKTDIKIILAFAAVYIIWGSTYLALKIGLQDIPPFLMASSRYLLAGFLMLAFHFLRKGTTSKTAVRQNMLLGVFMLTLGQGVLFWAAQYLPSGLVAVFIATLPVWYIVVDRRNWKGYFGSKLTLISIALSFVGIILLFNEQAPAGGWKLGNMAILASLVVIGSCLCWAAGSLYYKYNLSGGSVSHDVGFQLVGGGISCLVISLFMHEAAGFQPGEVRASAWGAVCYLAIAGSIIAFTASYYLLARKPAAVVGTYAYVNPIIAVLLGYMILGENINAREIAAMLIILLAAYLANRVKLEQA